MNPVIAAALIAGGISVASFGFNAWTTSRTLYAARAASLRDRQASIYQQILAFASHRAEIRRDTTRMDRYDKKTEARIKDYLASYTPPNTFELEASVLAFCPDSVMDAFIAARDADRQVWSSIAARADEVEAAPLVADPNAETALGDEAEARIEEAEQAETELIATVRDRMLGARPPEPQRRTLFELPRLVYTIRSRSSLR